MYRRSTGAGLLALILVLPSCGPAPTGDAGEGSQGEPARAIHIADAGGVPVPAIMRVGALGALFFRVMVEDGQGSLQALDPDGQRQATWGSTNPGVADASRLRGATEVHFNRNGEARIIAYLDGLRDTVTLQIHQVPFAGRIVADTIVTLSRDARDLSGAPSAYHGFRYGTVRVDSNGYTVATTERLEFDPGIDGLFEVVPEPREDTIAVLGIRPGVGRLVTRLREVADTTPVQVADAYRVVRLIETPSGAVRTLPDTVRIPAGAAVIFQNETRRWISVAGVEQERVDWFILPFPPNGRQARIFTRPGVQHFTWYAGYGKVIVTP